MLSSEQNPEPPKRLMVGENAIEVGPVGMTARILVAEDNHINQKIITAILTEFAYEFDIVDNGGKALEAVRDGSYDLVLMDLEMPEMDGMEATAWIRDQISSNIPIIAVTANADHWEETEILGAGMNAMVAKPLNAMALIQAIDEQINGSAEIIELPVDSGPADDEMAMMMAMEAEAEQGTPAPQAPPTEGMDIAAVEKAMEHLDAIAKVTDDAGDTIVGALEEIEKALSELQDDPSPSRFYDLCNAIEEKMLDAMQACGFTDLVAQKIKTARESMDPNAGDAQEGAGAGFSQDDIDSLFD